jgi:hypothetical protein
MKRAMLGTIGAAALCCVALVTRPQTPPATPPASSASTAPTHAISQTRGLIVYPAKGQSADQQSVDEQQCYDWSQTQRQETFGKALRTCLQGRGYTTG